MQKACTIILAATIFFAILSQAPVRCEYVDSGKVDIGQYKLDLQRRVRRHWFPIKDQKIQGHIAKFKVHSDGHITDLHLVNRVGQEVVNEQARDAVLNASPFRALPAGAPSILDMQIEFDKFTFNGYGLKPSEF